MERDHSLGGMVRVAARGPVGNVSWRLWTGWSPSAAAAVSGSSPSMRRLSRKSTATRGRSCTAPDRARPAELRGGARGGRRDSRRGPLRRAASRRAASEPGRRLGPDRRPDRRRGRRAARDPRCRGQPRHPRPCGRRATGSHRRYRSGERPPATTRRRARASQRDREGRSAGRDGREPLQRRAPRDRSGAVHRRGLPAARGHPLARVGARQPRAGDAVAPRTIHEAVLEGRRVALALGAATVEADRPGEVASR